MAKISVFLPCYNAENFIDTCILSLLAQTYNDFVVLAYDDNSTDSTLEHLTFWENQDSRTQVKQPFNQRRGYVKLLNQMLLDVNTDYICRQDADDWSLPNRFYEQMHFMENISDCVLCGTQGQNLWEDEHKLFTYEWESEYVNAIASFSEPISDLLYSHHRVIHGSMCMRTQALRDISGYDESLMPIEDWDLSLRLSKIGEIYIVPKILYVRRLHLNNTAKDHPNKTVAIEAIREKHNLKNYEFQSFRSERY